MNENGNERKNRKVEKIVATLQQMREQRFQIYDDMAFSIQCKWLLFIAEHIDRVSYVHLACMYIKSNSDE